MSKSTKEVVLAWYWMLINKLDFQRPRIIRLRLLDVLHFANETSQISELKIVNIFSSIS